MNLRDRFNSLNLESQIVFLICGFGSISMFVAVLFDLVRSTPRSELAVDALILLTLSFLTYLSWNQSIQRISIVFGMLLSVLLAINFLQFGGASGYMKFNYYTGLYIIILVYSFRQLVITVVFHLLLLITIIVLDLMDHPLRQLFFISSSPETLDFWFTIIIISAFTYYLKQLTDTYSRKLSVLNIDLADRIKEGRNLSRLLQSKNGELKTAQLHLEHEINRRSEVLNNKNELIENFLKANTSDLIDPVQALIKETKRMSDRSPLSPLLTKSVADLEQVSKSIREAIESDVPVHRKMIG